MNKKGFAFIETIITVVILSASLLILYSSYSAIINDEKTRLYYDDPAFIYYTNYVKKFLEEYSEIENVKKYSFNDTYIVTIGTGLENSGSFIESIFSDEKSKTSLEKIVGSFKINQIVLVKSSMFNNCFKGTEENCDSSLKKAMSYGMQKYISSLSDTTYDYYLVIEYASKLEDETEENKNYEKKLVKCTPGLDKKCQTYYASVGMYAKIEEQENTQKLSEYVISQYNGVQGNNGIYYHDSTLSNGAGDNSHRYAGSNPNNFLCFASDATPCSTDNLYRIIGVFKDQVKIIKYDYATSSLLGKDGDYQGSGIPDRTYYKGSLTTNDVYCWNKKTETNTWSESLLNKTNLNTNFITNIGEEWANKIATTTWKVGGNKFAKISQVVPSVAYQNEIVNPDLTNTNDRAKEYTAKIGLMYVSDYTFAASPNGWTLTIGSYLDTRNINWMHMGLSEWTISRISDFSNQSYAVGNYGGLDTYGVNNGGLLRPSFYLLSSVIYAGGIGTALDPIRIK